MAKNTLSFESLGLKPETLQTLEDIGFTHPSPIQTEFIPVAMTGRDCIGQAQTGTGKTAAFVLPILERLELRVQVPQALVLAPTRELSQQVADEATKLSAGSDVRVACIVGGKSIRQQADVLRKGAPIVVGTPGRVIDLVGRRMLDLSALKFVVLDEADRMLDIGFRPAIERILRSCPTERQTLLLSATMPAPVERLAQRYMQDPLRVDLSGQQVATSRMDQYYITIDPDRKFQTLVRLLVHERPRQAIVFTRTRRGAEKLFHKFKGRLRNVSFMHGDLTQPMRDKTMRQFRDGTIRLLIATDVVGRGIDVSGVSHIINYDVPEDCDDYVHRIGRAGRLSSGGRRGHAFTLLTREEGGLLTNIEKRVNTMLESYQIPGFEAARPVKKRAHADETRQNWSAPTIDESWDLI